jgi:uncharacterized protein YegL
MKKGLTELVFILDRSGSMSGLESDTIGGFNGMLKKQKETPDDAIITTVLFDDKYELLHDRIDIKGVAPLTEKQYYVRGCTALLDAVGKTIHKIDLVQNNTIKELQAEKVIFVITTDGLENASNEFSYKKLKQIIDKQKRKGWEFIFMGANMDAVLEAERLGINQDRAVTFQNDSEGVMLNYEVLSEAISNIRCKEETLGADWKKRIEEDTISRGSKSRLV